MHQPPGVAAHCVEVAAQAVEDHVGEHGQQQVVPLRTGRGPARGDELSGRREAVALVPGQVNRPVPPLERAGRATNLVCTVTPGPAVQAHGLAARRRHPADHRAARADGLDRDRRLRAGGGRHVGADLEDASLLAEDRRPDLRAWPQACPRLQHPHAERPGPGGLRGLDEQGVLARPQVDHDPVLVRDERARAEVFEHEPAVDPHPDALVRAEHDLRLARTRPGERPERVRHAVARTAR